MNPIAIGNYQIDIFKYPFSHYSAVDGEEKYDLLHFQENEYSLPTIIGIKIYHSDGLLKSALLGAQGGGTTVHKTSFITELNRIVTCCSDTIFCLSIPDLSLIWKTKADQSTCFEIFKYNTDYIVHGELEITRLDNNGNILWQREGADIFTTLNSVESDFIITQDHILATDWGNRKYKFDFDGGSIE
jgi:outer membrane protein assembly factor BamB